MIPVTRPAARLRIRMPGIPVLVGSFFVLFALYARPAILADALDNTAVAWRTGNHAPWITDTVDTHDGLDAARSGPILDGEESWIETSLTGPAPVSFWWKVSSELGYDQLQFLIDGVEQVNISGEESWHMRAFDIPSGVHTLRWRYVKDATESAGLDRGWLDQFTYTPPAAFAPIIFEEPIGRSVAAGSTVTFSVSAAALPEPTYQWFHNNAPLPSATNSLLTLNSVNASAAGVYTVVVRNSLGSTVSEPAVLKVTTVGDAVEATELAWTIGGEGTWFGQNAVTHDGIDALESTVIDNLQETWVQTRATGPGMLVFWWKVSSEPFYDGLQFLTNGVVAASLSGEATWEQKIMKLPPGPFSLRWRYFKDGSISQGQDKGWLDEVGYMPNQPPTNLLVSLNRSTIPEGDSVVLSGSFSDSDALDTHTLVINWRDGSSTVSNLPAGIYSFSATHKYEDDDPTGSASDSYPISVVVSDEAASMSVLAPLTISNSPPLLAGASVTGAVFPFETVTLSGSLSDIGLRDNLRLIISWGDAGQNDLLEFGPGAHSFTLRHKYSLANTNVRLTVSAIDDDEGRAIAQTNVTIRPLPVQARLVALRKGTNSQSAIRLQGSPLANYQVQASTDLVHWLTIGIRTAGPTGFFDMAEPGGFGFQRRYYRAIWESQTAGMRFSSISKGSNGLPLLALIGLPGATYRLDSSTNFLSWSPAATVTMDSNGMFNFIDAGATLRRKFYRAVIP